jgi:hypothetical protein
LLVDKENVMAVDISGFDLEVRTVGIIHSNGESVLFTIEKEPPRGVRNDPVLRFFQHIIKPQPESTSDYLYFCARNAVQRVNFVWGADPQNPLLWQGVLNIPKDARD